MNESSIVRWTDTRAAGPQMSTVAGDLRLQVGEAALIQLALEAATVVGAELQLRSGIADGNLNPQMLLTLLTYSYAAGLYASEDIEWACQNDPAARYIVGNVEVEEDLLRAFRRANRPWIEGCLAWVMLRVAATKQGQVLDSQNAQAGLESLQSSACLDLARHRVELAVLMDMAMAD